MMSGKQERRAGERFPLELAIDLHAQGDVVPVRALDVSRHGLFVACPQPPPLHTPVLITVKLRSGSFDTLATVVRRVEQQRQGALGAGLKLFCLGAEAKQRWDRFVGALESPGLALPTRPIHQIAACFLVQPEHPAALLEFFTHSVLADRTLYVSPAVRLLGAEVSFVLVHPRTHEESHQRAHVVEWSPDQPQRMGVRFAPVDTAGRQAFMKFLGDVPGAVPPPLSEPLVRVARAGASEYAYFSPKLQAQDELVELLLVDEVIDKEDLFDFSWTNSEED